MLAVSLVQSKAFVSANPQNCKTGTIPILQVRKLWPEEVHIQSKLHIAKWDTAI